MSELNGFIGSPIVMLLLFSHHVRQAPQQRLHFLSESRRPTQFVMVARCSTVNIYPVCYQQQSASTIGLRIFFPPCWTALGCGMKCRRHTEGVSVDICPISEGQFNGLGTPRVRRPMQCCWTPSLSDSPVASAGCCSRSFCAVNPSPLSITSISSSTDAILCSNKTVSFYSHGFAWLADSKCQFPFPWRIFANWRESL